MANKILPYSLYIYIYVRDKRIKCQRYITVTLLTKRIQLDKLRQKFELLKFVVLLFDRWVRSEEKKKENRRRNNKRIVNDRFFYSRKYKIKIRNKGEV